MVQVLEKALSNDEIHISRINVGALKTFCDYLGLSFDFEYYSDMSLKLGSLEKSSDWALRISQALGATEYINSPGGINIYNPSEFEQLGIKLTIRPFQSFEYECPGYKFVPNLSIVDVLMWNSPEKIKQYLDQLKLSA